MSIGRWRTIPVSVVASFAATKYQQLQLIHTCVLLMGRSAPARIAATQRHIFLAHLRECSSWTLQARKRFVASLHSFALSLATVAPSATPERNDSAGASERESEAVSFHHPTLQLQRGSFKRSQLRIGPFEDHLHLRCGCFKRGISLCMLALEF